MQKVKEKKITRQPHSAELNEEEGKQAFNVNPLTKLHIKNSTKQESEHYNYRNLVSTFIELLFVWFCMFRLPCARFFSFLSSFRLVLLAMAYCILGRNWNGIYECGQKLLSECTGVGYSVSCAVL